MATIETATFAAGCFWCTEAIFQRLKGVKTVTSGYTGGSIPNPSYKQVSSGTTGHAEAIQITFDPAAISYEQLLEIFWKTHDPTTKNQQGPDAGPQYRSVIFFHTERQKAAAEKTKARLEQSGYYKNPVVTEIAPVEAFYPAEEYHQDFFGKHPDHPYCTAIIEPKIAKLVEKDS